MRRKRKQRPPVRRDLWVLELRYGAIGGVRSMRSLPMTYSRAYSELARYEAHGYHGQLVELAGGAP